MNRILVPTDFSENAINAMKFALQIADKTGAKVIVFHSNHVPVISPETPFQVYETITKEIEKASVEKLENQKLELLTQLKIDPSKVKIETIVKLGFAVDEILEISENRKVDLIIMGTKGASGLKKTLIGTNTESVIRQAICPVLVIPEGCHFKQFERIVLAIDYHDEHTQTMLAPLLELAHVFNSELLIFNVKLDEEYVPSFEEASEGLKLESQFRRINHNYFFAENEDPLEAIDEFVQSKNADLLVMMPHKQTLFQKIFGVSLTCEMAFHTKVPLLTMPINEL